MKGQPKRQWEAARAKVEVEGRCRYGHFTGHFACDGPLEAAHIIGREHDKKNDYRVSADRVVPLCMAHHRRYDPHLRGNDGPFDLWPYLTLEEQAQAIEDAGGFWLAVKRAAPLAYKRANSEVAA